MSENNKKTLADVMEALAEPFPADAIYWKPQTLNREKTRGLAVPYADPRAYEDKLNAVVPKDWGTKAQFTVAGPKLVCIVHLTVLGVTRAGDGEADLDDSNAATSAYAQAFKRAASRFGLGRYLYDLPTPWEDYDPKKKQFTEAAQKRLRALYLKAIKGLEAEGSVAKGGDGAKPKAEPKVKSKPEDAEPRGAASEGLTLEAARAVVVSMGKHKGKTLAEVAETDLDYLAWLAGAKGDPKKRYHPRSAEGEALVAAAKVLYASLAKETPSKADGANEPEAEPEEAGSQAGAGGNGLDEALTTVVPFGKYRGKTLGELAADEDGQLYVAWLAGEAEFGGKTFQPRYKRGKELAAAAKVVWASLQEAA